MRLFFFILILALFPVSVFSSPYDMIAAGDQIIDDILYLSLESGKSVLSFTPPFAPDEVKMFLDSIDFSQLPQAAQEAYERISKRLQPDSRINLAGDNFLLMLDINSTLEFNVRFNSNIDWYPQYKKAPPLLALPLRFNFSDFLQLYIEPVISKEYESYRGIHDGIHSGNTEKADNTIISYNVPAESFDNVDMTIPFKAYITMGNSWSNFQLGRDRLFYGTGHMGNLAVSDNPAYYDFARLSLFSGFFKYSLLVSQMPLDIRGIYENHENSGLTNTTQRYFYLHRIDFKLFDVLSVAVSEGVIAGNSAVELRYINPMIVFHSLFSFWNYPPWTDSSNPSKEGDMNGSLFSAEINWNIVKSLAVYGQFAMNQVTLPYEIEKWPDSAVPNGMGFLLGSRCSASLGAWSSVFRLEFIYTDPYLYLNPSPYASFIHMRLLGISPDRLQYSFTGYPRDRIAVTFGTEFFKGDLLLLSADFTWLSQGSHGIFWDWDTPDAVKETTPSGTAENNFIASAGIRWKINSYFTLNSALTGVYSVNNNHINDNNIFGGQASVSVSFHY